MKNKGIVLLLIGALIVPLMTAGVAEARQTFRINLIRDVYPHLLGTKFESTGCLWCHVEDKAGPRNDYGLDYEAQYAAYGMIGAALQIEQLDSDGDGYTNYEEISAATWPGFADDTPSGTTCTDDDFDGYAVEGGGCGEVDCNDANPTVHPNATEICDDGIDNNCIGKIDCLDQNCSSDSVCMICTDNDTDGYAVEGGGCGATDCNDNDLAVSPGAVENCSDLIDNDCDGLLDCTDADCNGDAACAPTCIPEASREKGKKCSDGIDNDCDDVTDADDPDCGGDTSTGGTEGSGKTCRDGIDNDGDSLVDCADPDCSRSKSCR